MSLRHSVLSLLALVWGAAILVAAVSAHHATAGGSAYGAGHMVGNVLGGVLVLAGARGLFVEYGRQRRR